MILFFANEGKINNFSRNDFEKLLRMALQNNFFNFDGKIYKQTDGVAMEYLFRSPNHLGKFINNLNSKHKNINFTCEKENNKSQPFQDIWISRSEDGFKLSVYHKQTFSGVYFNFHSFIYDQ